MHEKLKKLNNRVDIVKELDHFGELVRANFNEEKERTERGKQKLQNTISDHLKKSHKAKKNKEGTTK